MVQIIKQQFSLYKKEIEDWQASRQMALQVYMPRRIRLYQLYLDARTDPFISGQWKNRVNRVTNKKFKIVSRTTGEEQPEKTAYFKKKWFRKFVSLSLESVLEGYSLIYTNKLVGNQIKEVELLYREHVLPEVGQIIFEQSDFEGPSYLEGELAKYCIGIGEPKDLGLLEKLVPLYILRKHSWQSWDQFEEMFGMPIRIAKTASTDKRVQAQISSWLEDLGSAGYALFPTGTDVEIKESTRSDAFGVFQEKRKACNEEIAILINGQFETSNNSGSKAKTKSVVESTQDEITLDDLQFLEFDINEELIPKMIALTGYDLTDDDVFEWDKSEVLKLMEKIQVYKTINDMGYELDQEEVSQTFGVKITGKKAPVVPPPNADEPKPGDAGEDAEPEDGDEPLQHGKLVNPKKVKTEVEQLLNMHRGIAGLYKQVE